MKKITAQQIIDLMFTYPNRRANPTGDNGCLYTDEFGNHCIAGQILEDLGFDAPAYESFYNDESIGNVLFGLKIRDRFTDDAVRLLTVAQAKADSVTNIDHVWGDPLDTTVAWGHAKIHAYEEFESLVANVRDVLYPPEM